MLSFGGIYHNLILAKNHGLQIVIVESDALTSINMIQNVVRSTSEYRHFVLQIIEFIHVVARFYQVDVYLPRSQPNSQCPC